MAKVVTGGGVGAISGKIGANVFARNKGGAYMRNFAKPTNPNTSYQQNARDRLTQYSNEWRSLTEGQQEAWTAYAETHPVLDRLGATIYLTGAQAYVKVNTNRDLAGDATTNSTVPGDAAFTPAIFDVATALVIDISDGSLDVSLGAGAAADQVVFLYVSPLQSAGVQNVSAVLRLLEAHTITAGEVTAGLIDVGAAYIARFGALTGQAGKKVVAFGYEYDQGVLSAGSRMAGLVTA